MNAMRFIRRLHNEYTFTNSKQATKSGNYRAERETLSMKEKSKDMIWYNVVYVCLCFAILCGVCTRVHEHTLPHYPYCVWTFFFIFQMFEQSWRKKSLLFHYTSISHIKQKSKSQAPELTTYIKLNAEEVKCGKSLAFLVHTCWKP